MTQIPSNDTQLDKIESKVDQVLDRLTRMEERQNSHAGTLEAHSARLDEHAGRLRDVELAHAVNVATGTQTSDQLKGRWAAIGSTALVIVGALGAAIGTAIMKIIGSGS